MALLECNFVSYSLEHGVNITVTLPTLSSCDFADNPCHTPRAKYPVLYLLHGKGNDYQSWLRYTGIGRLAEEQQIAVVTFSCGNRFYLNCPNHENYFDFLEQELPEFVSGNFPISDRPEDRYLAGLSMGGYGTLIHALSCPAQYAAFGAFSSPVRTVTASQEISGAPDVLALLDGLQKAGGKMPQAYLACGTEDSLFADNRELEEAFASRGVPHVWHAVPGYAHEWRFWDMEIVRFLDWLKKEVRTDAYAPLPLHKI
ncbi:MULTISPECIES: alpha/beta hydrolase [Caproicibacterium]|uniref:Alpha/beta hydrolase family protein n=1 Tax=Caproicibacterium argilliputei TaxID=3030016 RepID=A0AA97DA95_9FIRM|nr:alpha/beta hydrolase family protein [Caproicibacterium argilliputei]WOC32502.1 alpha/beta hydrolase family protein [Caproicibacterium argilliputei]